MAAFNDFHGNLFRRIKDDDRLALNTLFAEYYQKLCGFANSFLRNEQEAEECVADVFVNIWKTRKTLVIEKSIKAYLYTSVKNAVFASMRKRYPLFNSIDDLTVPLESDNNAEKDILFAELQQRIDKAIESLPPRCRQVFIMSRIDSLSYKTIAEVLDISEKTVENHLVKALANLRTILSGHNKSNVVSH